MNTKTKWTRNGPDWSPLYDTKLQQGGCKLLLSFDGRDHKLRPALPEPAKTTKIQKVEFYFFNLIRILEERLLLNLQNPTKGY